MDKCVEHEMETGGCCGHMSYSLDSSRRGYIREYYRAYSGDLMSVDCGSYGVKRLQGGGNYSRIQ